MKTLILLRDIFRVMLLTTLIFRLFFVKHLSYIWNISSYIILSIGLVGMIIMEIVIYMRNKSKKI